MKGTCVLQRRGFFTAAVILSSAVLVGCAGSGDAGGDGIDMAAKQYGLERAEYIALRKANRDPKKFEKAIQERKIEDLKEKGVVVKAPTSPNKTTRLH
jgi:hypothetical protein